MGSVVAAGLGAKEEGSAGSAPGSAPQPPPPPLLLTLTPSFVSSHVFGFWTAWTLGAGWGPQIPSTRPPRAAAGEHGSPRQGPGAC